LILLFIFYLLLKKDDRQMSLLPACQRIFVCFLGYAFVVSRVFASQSTMPKAPYVTSQTVKKWQEDGQVFLFVDVREASEFQQGHLPGASNIPYHDLQQRIPEVPKDRPVIFYCTYSSWRAPYAGNLLADYGFDNVYVLEGGASGWNAGGQVIYAKDPNQDAKIVPKPKDLEAVFDHPLSREYPTKVYLTKEQLKKFDGKNGNAAYVAVDGVIYDVTQSRLWRGGEHDPSHGRAWAGEDLTAVLEESPHGDKHLQHFPVVGWLTQEGKEKDTTFLKN
jgi:predicted heme/steroid binding protein/rhodanese-related sulfurtransferase